MTETHEQEIVYDQESKTALLDDILIEKFEKALHKPTQAVVIHDIAKIAAEHSAVDLAIAASRLPPQARAVLFQNFTTIQEQIKFLIGTDSTTRIVVFREIADEEIIRVIDQMPPDEAVEVLEDLSERRCKKVIDGLEPSKALRIMEIEKNARNTAGRLMTNEFFAFSEDVSIGEVADTIRNKPGIDLTRRIFVLDQEGLLQGYVSARTLIVNDRSTPIKQVVQAIEHRVTAEVSREEVVEIVERYKISAVPVVDEENKLIGVITYEDVVDALEDILDETIGSVAGTSEKVSEHESTWKRFFSRIPWLFVTLCAGLLNVGVMSAFDRLATGMLTFVLFFVPLITGMSGNIGIQCSTVLVRSMALGVVTPGNRRKSMGKEIMLGMMNAVFFGLLCGMLVFTMKFSGITQTEASSFSIALIVSCGLIGACLAGTLLGVLSPFFFSRVGVDPAVASGPIVTALNDFLSMAIYFIIAIGIGTVIL